MAWAPDYTTVAGLKAYVRIGDGLDDVQLAVAISAASRAVDAHCNRQFGKVDAPDQRAYTARPSYETGHWVVDVDDLASASITLAAPVAAEPYRLEPVNSAAKGRPWTRIAFEATADSLLTGDPFEVSVTATWGWPAVPAAVEQATLLQASRLAKRRDAPFGVAGSPEMGSELRLLAKVDPDVAVALHGFRRPRALG